MHLVVDHVMQLNHIDVAHGSRLVEAFSGFPIVQISTTVTRQTCHIGIMVDFFRRSTIEDRRSKLQAQLLPGPA